MGHYFGNVQFISWLFQRCLAALYFIAFISVLDQFPALLGENGLLPVRMFIKSIPFAQAPSIFYFNCSDSFVKFIALVGVGISVFIFLAITDKLPWFISTIFWLLLWFLYLSVVNVGQQFYSFGWESMLLEAGFFAAFIGPASMVSPIVPIIILRWMLFRVEFGAGLIKI